MKAAWLTAGLFALLAGDLSADPANPMVHQEARRIVDAQNRPLQLRGVNLGGWLLWEGWIFGDGFTAQTTIKNKLTQLVGPEQANRFSAGVYDNFITETDITQIAALGFNSVRVPLSWRLLQHDIGWQVLDRLVDNCQKHGVYVVLDLHSVPGGQSSWFTGDPGPGRDRVWNSPDNQQLTVSLWKKIAQRYRDRTIVGGYDLINEPAAPTGEALAGLYQRIITAVRTVDTNHLVILEGNKLATDFSMFARPLSDNQAYSFHLYNWFGDDRAKRLAQYQALSAQQNVPVWCGEFGENKYAMIHSTVQMFEKPEYGFSGWAYWTWKRAPATFPGLVLIHLPPDWEPVIRWIGSPFRQKPALAPAETGMDEFLQAVRFENCRLNQQMVEALKP